MAKKVVATLKREGDNVKYAKVIKAVKNPETGAYSFKEEIMPEDQVKNAFK
jgi:hypothetical protein